MLNLGKSIRVTFLTYYLRKQFQIDQNLKLHQERSDRADSYP